MKKNKKPFYVMVIVIIIMYAVIYILRPRRYPVSLSPVYLIRLRQLHRCNSRRQH